MNPDPTFREPRLVTVSRRSPLLRAVTAARSGRLLRSSAMVGALLVLPGLACGTNNDADVFAAAGDAPADSATVGTTATSTATSSTAASTSASTGTTEVATTLAGDQATTTVIDATAPSGAVFPAGAELAVSFTFEPTSSGPARNPYIAVWVEDQDGNLVDTISVWYAQGGKGQRWLSDLRSWYSTSDGSADATVVGATRAAGSYTVVWDGTDMTGTPVDQGSYVLYVEAAREHGPYELTAADLTIGDAPFTVTLDDQGELSNVSAELML